MCFHSSFLFVQGRNLVSKNVEVEQRLTPAISRRARNLETIQVSRMRATLFAVGCMALLGAAQFYDFKQMTCPTMCCSDSTFTPAGFQVGRRCP